MTDPTAPDALILLRWSDPPGWAAASFEVAQQILAETPRARVYVLPVEAVEQHEHRRTTFLSLRRKS